MSAPWSAVGSSTPGNRSDVMPRNSGRSSTVNLGRFTSMTDRSTIFDSSQAGSSPTFKRKLPAATRMELTARMP